MIDSCDLKCSPLHIKFNIGWPTRLGVLSTPSRGDEPRWRPARFCAGPERTGASVVIVDNTWLDSGAATGTEQRALAIMHNRVRCDPRDATGLRFNHSLPSLASLISAATVVSIVRQVVLESALLRRCIPLLWRRVLAPPLRRSRYAGLSHTGCITPFVISDPLYLPVSVVPSAGVLTLWPAG